MAERAIFLDRDNTLVEDKDGYLGDPARVRLLPGAATAVAALRRMGYRIIVVSNQSGVARGMFDEAAVEAVNQEMCRLLREQAGAHIDASYYCPYHPEAVLPQYRMDHDWRKPKCGMLKQAAEDFGLDLAQSWMIGDAERDIAAGAAAGCRTILLRDPDHPGLDLENGAGTVSPNFIVRSLADAARIIAREGRNPHPDLVPTPLPEKPIEKSIEKPADLPSEKTTPQPPVPTPALPAPAAPRLDEQAIADRVGRRLEKSLPKVENLKPVLEDILVQLRHQNRDKDLPDFNLGRLVVILTEVIVGVCLVLALLGALGVATPDPKNSFPQIHALIRSGLWLLAGLVLQGFAILVMLGSRR